jgi:hypothetical protein
LSPSRPAPVTVITDGATTTIDGGGGGGGDENACDSDLCEQAQATAVELFRLAADAATIAATATASNPVAAVAALSFCTVASPCLNAGACVDVAPGNAAAAAAAAAAVAADADADATVLYKCFCTPYFTDAVCSLPLLKVISLTPSSVSIFGGVVLQLYGKCICINTHASS